MKLSNDEETRERDKALEMVANMFANKVYALKDQLHKCQSDLRGGKPGRKVEVSIPGEESGLVDVLTFLEPIHVSLIKIDLEIISQNDRYLTALHKASLEAFIFS